MICPKCGSLMVTWFCAECECQHCGELPCVCDKDSVEDLQPCAHEDTDRVGLYGIVCYGCLKVADYRDLMAGKEDAWKALRSGPTRSSSTDKRDPDE